MNYDNIYASPLNKVDSFTFDAAVVQVFSDMIARSVPGYRLTLPLIGLMAKRYAQPNSNLYDLGCSLGAVTLSIRPSLSQPNCRIVAVDSSAAMIAKCREVITTDHAVPVELVEADIRDVPIERASVVVLHYTLQFIPPTVRRALLQKIYDGMLPGGALILSEKVHFVDEGQNGRFDAIHHDFKRANGYSDLEISQKRTALENVLLSDTIEQHQARLKVVGFATADVWFQALNFVSLLALKL